MIPSPNSPSGPIRLVNLKEPTGPQESTGPLRPLSSVQLVPPSVAPAWEQLAAIDEDFAQGEIDQAEWHARMAAVIVPAYLAGDNARAQSGYGGTEADWRQARGLVADAISRSGTFLDVGCASGLLMESVADWCRENGLAVEPYGLDIAPELVTLARTRLPNWADRIFVGNAANWRDQHRFDVVRTGHDYVPRAKLHDLIGHLLANVVAPTGQLLIGPYTEERDGIRPGASLEDQLRGAGFHVVGRSERPHPRDERVIRRLLTLDDGRSVTGDRAGVKVRPMVAGDAVVLARAFSAIGWSSKPVGLFERYFDEQSAGARLVLVAMAAGQPAGYVTVNWRPRYLPLVKANIPELQDLNVLPPFRRQGIGTRLCDRAEEVVGARSNGVGIGVGLHPGYNAAQRMYVRRGYVPDGHGVTMGDDFVREGQTVVMDDEVVLHLVKSLTSPIRLG
jgi:GNAT superfamily N-acetyltransferase